MSLLLQNGELILYGPVASADSFYPGSFSANDVIAALAQHGDDAPLTVRLNCPGGDAFEGVSIYNALSRRSGLTVVVEGLAASAGSLIAMAGETIIMAAGSLMMLHEAHGGTLGPASAHSKQADILDRISAQYAALYAARSGGSPEATRASMEQETWFTAAEAVAAGFANKVEDAKAKTFAAFDYRIYAKAPETLKALAIVNNWLASARPPSAADERARADQLQGEVDALKADAEREAQIREYEASRAGVTPARGAGLTGRGAPRPRSGPTNWNDFLPR